MVQPFFRHSDWFFDGENDRGVTIICVMYGMVFFCAISFMFIYFSFGPGLGFYLSFYLFLFRVVLELSPRSPGLVFFLFLIYLLMYGDLPTIVCYSDMYICRSIYQVSFNRYGFPNIEAAAFIRAM